MLLGFYCHTFSFFGLRLCHIGITNLELFVLCAFAGAILGWFLYAFVRLAVSRETVVWAPLCLGPAIAIIWLWLHFIVVANVDNGLPYEGFYGRPDLIKVLGAWTVFAVVGGGGLGLVLSVMLRLIVRLRSR